MTDTDGSLQNERDSEAKLGSVIDELGAVAGIRSLRAMSGLDPLSAALDMVAAECGLPVTTPLDNIRDATTNEDKIRQFAFLNGWRVRKVRLHRKLSSHENGTMIAFDAETDEPVVLAFQGGRREIHDPSSGRHGNPAGTTRRTFKPHAFYFYEQLPDTPVSTRQLFSFLAKGSGRQFRTIFLIGIVAGLFALVFPVVVQYVTGEVIPSANMMELDQLAGLLIVLTVSSVVFGIVPQLVMMSLGATRFERFQAALCDRILKSPLHLFKRFNVGDLTQRILSATRIQDTVLSVISNQALSSVFSLCSMFMLFYFSTRLAIIGILFTLAYACAMFLLYKRNLVHLKQAAEADGASSGLLKQFIDGIAKIRVAGAETRVMSKYFEVFSDVVKADYRVNKNSAVMETMGAFYPALVSSVLFAVIVAGMSDDFALPRFLGFMSAYAAFQQGVTGIAGDIWSLLSVKPELERIKPILETPPEQVLGKQHPGRLDGTIEIVDLTFGYAPLLPPVLENVSLKARKGEFIAIVGPSGAGKSTLVRLLLGFETPASGGIYYSGYDLATLDLRTVRSQLGIILQNSSLIHGSILDNIIGGTDYTPDDARRAVELASFADDVASMPLGMHTIVSDQLVSGGQRQRILLARALVGNPAAVILDESTSALDNVTQQEISDNMAALDFTRIVIAHRLSTIREADRIYVLDDGKVCQCGTYDELLAVDGVFRNLALRQLVE